MFDFGSLELTRMTEWFEFWTSILDFKDLLAYCEILSSHQATSAFKWRRRIHFVKGFVGKIKYHLQNMIRL